MKLSSVFIMMLACLPAAAQPVITGVANAASFAVAGQPNANIALGSMFVIFGTGLGPATLTQVSSYPLPASQGLAGTSVNINTVSFAGQANAIMIYTSATQVAAIVPSSLNFTGTVVLTVTYNGRTSNSFFMHLTTSSFGAFTVNQSGLGAAVAQNYNSDSDQPLNNLAAPAQPGQVVTLWGTGLGPVKGAENQGPLPGQLSLSLQTYVGGQQAQLSYYGRSGCCSGVDQVVFTIPQGVAGCAVPVVVVINGIPSNTATIAVSPDGGACSDPLGTSSSDIQNGSANGTTRFANISLNHTDGGNPADSATAAFASTPFAKYAVSLGGAPVPGSCLLISGSGNASFPPSPATALDAGTAIQVSGPGGGGQLAKANDGSYAGVLGPIQAGSYTVSGSGGKDVGAFSASLTVPSPITWTNRTSLTSITPGNSFSVNWTGGDPNSFVGVEGVAVNQGTGLFGIFVCISPASAGTFTVPGYITAGLPAGQGLVVTTQNGAPSRFTASGLDQGYLTYASGSGVGPIAVGSSGGGTKQ
jgi:uncharacterized protein (TIGR03437 family)